LFAQKKKYIITVYVLYIKKVLINLLVSLWEKKMNFEDAVSFHGHACPGLALGFRVAKLALQELGLRARDEELVAIVENNSCAVDAIQLFCGCTFGKGNLIFRDYGKQVYTFIRRPHPEAVRIAINWHPPSEDPETVAMWKRYSEGDRSPEVTDVVQDRKARKMKLILEADDSELFEVKKVKVEMPEPARIYQSLTCDSCGEKVMEPRTRSIDGRVLCITCSEEGV
jgi:formylmethanofuran dehydrogenase subunit E